MTRIDLLTFHAQNCEQCPLWMSEERPDPCPLWLLLWVKVADNSAEVPIGNWVASPAAHHWVCRKRRGEKAHPSWKVITQQAQWRKERTPVHASDER